MNRSNELWMSPNMSEMSVNLRYMKTTTPQLCPILFTDNSVRTFLASKQYMDDLLNV